MSEEKYKVFYTLSKAYSRALKVPQQTFSLGPYKRRSLALKKARVLRAMRAEFILEDANGNWTRLPNGEWLSEDKGPKYSKVEIKKGEW